MQKNVHRIGADGYAAVTIYGLQGTLRDDPKALAEWFKSAFPQYDERFIMQTFHVGGNGVIFCLSKAGAQPEVDDGTPQDVRDRCLRIGLILGEIDFPTDYTPPAKLMKQMLEQLRKVREELDELAAQNPGLCVTEYWASADRLCKKLLDENEWRISSAN